MFKIQTTLAAITVAAALLSGCGPGSDSAVATTQRINGVGALPPQAMTGSRPLAATPKASFWLNGIGLGCLLPGGQFKTYRFGPNGARVDDGKSSVMAATVPMTGSNFYLQFSGAVQKFTIDTNLAFKESHVLDFSEEGKPFSCLVFKRDGYITEPSTIAGLASLPGQWQCSGDFGPIVIDSAGRYARNTGQGRLVLSSPNERASEVRMFLLGDLRDSMWAGAVSMALLDATGLANGLIKINGQDCKRV